MNLMLLSSLSRKDLKLAVPCSKVSSEKHPQRQRQRGMPDSMIGYQCPGGVKPNNLQPPDNHLFFDCSRFESIWHLDSECQEKF